MFFLYIYPSLVEDIFYFRETQKPQFLDVSLHCNVKLMILYGFLRMSCK